MPTHLPVRTLVAAALIVLATACTTAPPAPQPGASGGAAVQNPTPTAAIKVTQNLAQSPVASPPTTAPAAPTAAAKAAAPAASPAAPAPSPAAAVRVDPKGKLTYGLHVALSPAWLDPIESGASLSDFILLTAVHDGLVRPLPGNPIAPSLAESYEIAPDYKSATFRLRPGIKFHNGDPVTSEDVKFTYETYKGAQATAFKSKTERIETPDARTVRFVFKEPFFDFLFNYGSYSTAAAWIVPAKYYQQVGPDGFKKAPVGAGPYKFASQVTGESVEFEANPDYWRKAPTIKTLVIRALPEASTRLAALETGEIDVMSQVPAQLLERVRNNRQLQIAPVSSGYYRLEFPGFTNPSDPFHDKRVRQAVSLGLDRKTIVDFHTGGLGPVVGNWLSIEYPGAIELPPPAHDLAKAKQLMAEAGYPDGFDAGELAPFPPNGPLGEYLIGQLRNLGIRAKLVNMERAAFATKQNQGRQGFTGGILLPGAGKGTAGAIIGVEATCSGTASRVCLPEIEERYRRYETSVDPKERQQLLDEIQHILVDEYIFLPLLGNIFVNVQGPRIANKVEEAWGASSQYLYLGPYEDIRLKD